MRLLICFLLACLLGPRIAGANPCDQAAAEAAAQTGVPGSVLLAVTRVETGRAQNGTLAPWPWTANVAGKGLWFDTRQEAQAHLLRQALSGKRSFDVGCFQLNYRWHGGAFRSLDHMLDPKANALYAAGFLRDLRAEFGNWERAVGAYHSRTATYAEKYLARYRRVYARVLADRPLAQLPAVVSTRSPLGSLATPAASTAPATRGSLWP